MIAQDRKPGTLMEAMRYFDPETAYNFIRSIKWPEGPVCEKCGSVNVGEIKSRRRFQCRDCRAQFSLITGTIFQSTHLRLDQWCVGIWMLLNCRNGVSSCEIARTIGCKQQSAWHLLHRAREIIAQSNEGKLSGIIEADSTLVGGLVKHMHKRKREAMGGSGKFAGKGNKTIVHALKERKSGNVRAALLADETTESLREMIEANAEKDSLLRTDAWPGYRRLRNTFRHEYVNHMEGEYVRGDVHTNGCENFFNCLRRTLKGTYIRASAKHLESYVDESVFRFNIRKMSEWERFVSAMRLVVGKRLTYSELTGGAVR